MGKNYRKNDALGYLHLEYFLLVQFKRLEPSSIRKKLVIWSEEKPLVIVEDDKNEVVICICRQHCKKRKKNALYIFDTSGRKSRRSFCHITTNNPAQFKFWEDDFPLSHAHREFITDVYLTVK